METKWFGVEGLKIWGGLVGKRKWKGNIVILGEYRDHVGIMETKMETMIMDCIPL